MKKVMGIVGAATLVSLSGCATEGYVRTQVDLLTDRLGKLEAKVSQLSSQREADEAAIKRANNNSQEALNVTKKLEQEITRLDADAAKATAAKDETNANALKADAAAARAEKAANAAEQSASESRQMEKKFEKIFKLQQMK